MTTEVIPLCRPISNAFLLLGERPVLVDAGAPGDTAPLLQLLRDHGVAPSDLALLVLTHGHADHTGAAATLAASGVPVAIGTGDVGLLDSGVIGKLPVTGPAGALLRPFIRRMTSTPATASIHVSAPLRLDPYGVAGAMVPVGGHTPGSSVVLLDDGDAVVGDLFRAGFAMGRYDITSPRAPTGCDRRWSLCCVATTRPSCTSPTAGRACRHTRSDANSTGSRPPAKTVVRSDDPASFQSPAAPLDMKFPDNEHPPPDPPVVSGLGMSRTPRAPRPQGSRRSGWPSWSTGLVDARHRPTGHRLRASAVRRVRRS
jgi:glyoxylase-like metal-dependent hydrolase (beta-lactamase superfamily II)